MKEARIEINYVVLNFLFMVTKKNLYHHSTAVFNSDNNDYKIILSTKYYNDFVLYYIHS